ncbi:hypothetical protein [Halobacteriovorax sp.]|uniref:hypothetical protein n=1 Tax=Halobacteriovorax sp. TaxID=2020862 RepID=UPI003AF2C3F6
MKSVNMPNIDDIQLLKDLCSKTHIKCHPYLSHEYLIMLAQYQQFINNNGNPYLCPSVQIGTELRNALEYHYKNPLKCLSFISQVRYEVSTSCCPMCGSIGTGTVDHYLPQSTHPEFTIHSRNLIPSCLCNSKRGNVITGVNANERIIHPYFDNFLNQRLITCEFSGDLSAPVVRLRQLGANQTVTFHINNVVEKTNILNWLSDKWASLVRSPQAMLPHLPRGRYVTEQEVQNSFISTRDDKDLEFESFNNWFSIFFSGLENSNGVAAWIRDVQNNLVTRRIEEDES